MTPNEARREALIFVRSNLIPLTEVEIVRYTTYGFTLQIGEHLIRFSAQVEANKHPKKVKAKS